MIERYLKSGIRVKWRKPYDAPESTTGDVARSTRTANAMTYDGLDGELTNSQFMQVNVSTTGLTMRQSIMHDWLDYLPGGTAYMPVAGQDVLTGWMSGCPLARWTSSTGEIFVGHIGTIDSKPDANARVKSKFLARMEDNTTAFNPAGEWSPGEINALKAKFKKNSVAEFILGLITSTGEFYSILIFGIVPRSGFMDEWCIGGCKRANAMNSAQLRLLLK
jgi:hypothetical protein